VHAGGSSPLELRLAASMRLFWELRGHLGEGRATLAAALARDHGEAPEARARALNAAAVMAYRQGDLEETRRLIDESLVLYRELGDEIGVGRALGELGNVASESGDHARALALYEECASVLRATGNELGLATVLANIGDVAFKEGDYDRAARLLEEAVELQRKVNDLDGVASSLFTLGRVVFAQGATAEAGRILDESLTLATAVGYPEGIGYCLAGLGQVALAEGRPEQAARLFGAADATFERIGAAMQQAERDAFDDAVSAARDLAGQAVFAASWAEGRTLDLDQAVAEGRAAARDARADAPNGPRTAKVPGRSPT
jgi:tetratricopeptide (TPR) repeat protein